MSEPNESLFAADVADPSTYAHVEGASPAVPPKPTQDQKGYERRKSLDVSGVPTPKLKDGELHRAAEEMADSRRLLTGLFVDNNAGDFSSL